MKSSSISGYSGHSSGTHAVGNEVSADPHPPYAATDEVHRSLAGFSYHQWDSGKNHHDKPRLHRPVSQKNKDPLRLKGKSLQIVSKPSTARL
jgi:hypothetical protein